MRPPVKLAWLALLLAFIGGVVLFARSSSETAPPVRAVLVHIPNAHLVDERILVGGQPTEDQLNTVASAGYRTVINLRPEAEMIDWDEAAAATDLGLRYLSIPIAGGSDLTLQNAERLKTTLDQLDDGPIVIHCSSGNRVGALLALVAFHFEGASAAEALEFGLEHGLTRLEPEVTRHLAEQGEGTADPTS